MACCWNSVKTPSKVIDEQFAVSVDTSWKQGSVSLIRRWQNNYKFGQIEAVETVPLLGGAFSAQLVPQIAALLDRRGLDKHKLCGFVAASGPGSFTGLRVGLAAIKALAEILGKPIAALSVLFARARTCHDGHVVTILDAGRGGWYVGEYDLAAVATRSRHEWLGTPEELDRVLQTASDCKIVVAEEHVQAQVESLAAVKQHKFSARRIPRPGSAEIGCLGVRAIRSGEIVTPEELDANYIRRSDAEIFRK